MYVTARAMAFPHPRLLLPIAWILKMLTLRIGGSKAYEEFGAPLASGYIAGHMLALIPGIILGRVRFFIPF